MDLIAVLPFDVAMAFAGSGNNNESLVAASTRARPRRAVIATAAPRSSSEVIPVFAALFRWSPRRSCPHPGADVHGRVEINSPGDNVASMA